MSFIIKCKYYPCHFPRQSCVYCYCPFYPCKNEDTGGKWFETNNCKIWDCTYCYVVHYSDVVKLLKLDPDEKDKDRINEAWEKVVKWIESNSSE